MLNINDFEFGKTIFRSEKCSVLAATNKLNSEEVALKCYRFNSRDGKDYRAIMNEIVLLSKLKHPNIVNLIGFAEEKVYDEAVNSDIIAFYAVLEKMDGTLKQELKTKKRLDQKPGLDSIRKFVRDVFPVILYLSKNRIAHQDLKPSNILLHNNSYKIGDMCSGKNLYSTKGVGSLNNIEGTLAYFAPEKFEAFKNHEGSSKFNPITADVFSLGLILMEFCLLRKLKNINSREQLMVNLHQKFSDIDKSFNNKSLTHLLRSMLELDPATRKSLEEIMKDNSFEYFVTPQEMEHLEKFPFIDLDHIVENFLLSNLKEEPEKNYKEKAAKNLASRESQTEPKIKKKVEKKEIGVSVDLNLKSVFTDTTDLNKATLEKSNLTDDITSLRKAVTLDKITMTEASSVHMKLVCLDKSVMTDVDSRQSKSDTIEKIVMTEPVPDLIKPNSLEKSVMTEVIQAANTKLKVEEANPKGDIMETSSQTEETRKKRTSVLVQTDPDLNTSANRIVESLPQIQSSYSPYQKFSRDKEYSEGALPNEETSKEIENLIRDAERSRKEGHYTKALELYEKSFKLKWKTLNPEDGQLSSILYGLGHVCIELGNYTKGKELHEKSLNLRRKMFGEINKYTADSYNSMGVSYHGLGNFHKGLEFFEKALIIYEKIYGKESKNTALAYNNVGGSYSLIGNHEKALEYKMRALNIKIALYGEEHEETAWCYDNVGLEYTDLGNKEKAIEFKYKALEIRKKIFGDDNPQTAISYNNLAVEFGNQGENQRSLDFHKKSFDIRLRVFGEFHPETSRSYHNIGCCYYGMYDFDKAVEYFQKAYSIRSKILGEKHPDSQRSKRELEDSKERVMEIREKIS